MVRDVCGDRLGLICSGLVAPTFGFAGRVCTSDFESSFGMRGSWLGGWRAGAAKSHRRLREGNGLY